MGKSAKYLMENKMYDEFINLKMFKDNNNNIDWISISEYQVLSEDFIEKYQDKIDCGGMSLLIKYYQKILLKNIKMMLIGIIFSCIKNYLKNLLACIKTK